MEPDGSKAGYHPVLTNWDPLDPAEVADPYRTLTLARREAPVFYSEYFTAFVAANYDSVERILRDTARFSNRYSMGVGAVNEGLGDLLPNGFVWDHPSLENNDPPAHTRIRKLSDSAFKSSGVNKRDAEIRGLVDRLMDDFIDDGSVDFIARFADPLPGLAICEFLGVPESMGPQVIAWSDATALLIDPNLSAEERTEVARGQADFYAYCESFIQARREQPRDDLMSKLIEARVEDEPALTPPELISTFAHFLLGGNLTTRRLLGNMLLRLLQSPDQLDAIREDGTLCRKAVDETLRHTSSPRFLLRRAMEDVEVEGVPIPQGADILVMFASANRDEARFAEPEKFDIFRKDMHRHVGFGKGAHFCIGSPFAHLEARITLEQVIARMPNLRLASEGTPAWAPLVNHTGLERLDLAWDS